ncbi:MAG: hypothetical protein HY815_11585 [Candidatus Riflebacteria bacterium]|nr:hypothetical protein [Candidatus Riflebacteria bacterium]
MFELLKSRLSALHRDEAGLTVVEIVLLIALIVLPIVLILVFFGQDIKKFISDMWGSTQKEAKTLGTKMSSGS